MLQVTADKALFIKLGESGMWESDCVRDGTLRLRYQRVPHDLCMNGDWIEVEKVVQEFSADRGAATRHVNQIRMFYEADEKVLWVTFHGDRLWWCFSRRGVSILPDNIRERRTATDWSDTDIHGNPLLKSTLSGLLLSVQNYRGTICSIGEVEYLLHKINGTLEPHVAAAHTAYENLQNALIPIIRKLHPRDFEIFVDLMFRQAGWQRVGVSGGTEKDIDLALVSPLTEERIAVQVKSKANATVWHAYREKYSAMRGFSKFYFVTHSPDDDLTREAEDVPDPDFILWGVRQLASQAVRGGLTGWLLDKAL